MARPANLHIANDILRETAAIVEEKGAENLALLEVANRLGYTRTTIYLYYKNKDELLQATIDRSFEWFAQAQDAAEVGLSPVAALRRRVSAYLAWGIEHPNMYRLMFEHPAEKPVDSRRLKLRSAWLDRDRELIAQIFISIPEEQRAALELVDAGLWAISHGLVSLIISGRMFGPLGSEITVDEAKARAQRIIEGTLVLPPDEEVVK